MGIRQLTMSPGSEEKKPEQPDYGGYHGYPDYGGYNDRYDGNYDGSKYKNDWKEPEKERTDIIEIKIIITYKEIGKKYFDDDNIAFEPDAVEFKAKEMAYDRLTSLIGAGFESIYKMEMEANDYYEQYEIEIKLTPLKEE